MNKEIKQSIAVRADCNKIFNELLAWGQSRWWPENSLMRFDNLSGPIGEKTLYRQKIKFPFAPSWHTKNESVDKSKLCIKRVFLDGLFEGYEEIKISKDKLTPEVIYSFNYRVKGVFNKLMWKVLFKKLHVRNINMILQALKDYLEKR